MEANPTKKLGPLAGGPGDTTSGPSHEDTSNANYNWRAALQARTRGTSLSALGRQLPPPQALALARWLGAHP